MENQALTIVEGLLFIVGDEGLTLPTFAIDPETFLSKGRATPFAGWRVRGKCMETYVGGNCVWRQR